MARRHLSEQIFRVLLACYPVEFRYHYGPEMAEVFRFRRAAENPLALWLHVLADIALTAPKEHFHMLIHDLRYAVRTLWRAPAFTLAAVLTLALGIGANTAIFSVVNAVMLRPLPFFEPERLVRLWETNPKANIPFFSASVLNYLSWQAQAKSFENLAAFGGTSLNIASGNEPERVPGGSITHSMFSLLGIRPLIGRDFLPEEQKPNQNRVAILSEALWKRRFGSDPSIAGKTVELNGATHQIVGVAPAEFRFPSRAEIWVPMVIDSARESRGNKMITVVGRLKPGVSLAQVEAEMSGIAQHLAGTYPDTNKDWGVRMARFYDWIVPEQTRNGLAILLGAVALVLLIACVNVASLLLARGVGRSREIAVRTTLGASRIRLMRQLLTESLLLALGGGVAGCVLAYWAVQGLKLILPQNLPRIGDIAVDGAVLAYALAVSAATGLLFGIAPLWQATRKDLNEALKAAGRANTSSRPLLRGALVMLEVSLATVLVIAASLLVQSLMKLQKVQLGFNSDNLLTAQLSLPELKYPGESAGAFYNRLLDRLNSAPGVTAAAISSGLPFASGAYTSMIAHDARKSETTPAEAISAQWRMVSADYFRAMEIPILRGHTFNPQDESERGSMVISAALARGLWGERNPVGEELALNNTQRYLVVGVVGDIRHATLDQEPVPAMYFPAPRNLWPSMNIVLRTSGDPRSAIPVLREIVRELDVRQPLFDLRTMNDWLDNSAAQPRAYSLLLSIFAGLALLLACIGIFGVLSYSVSQRTPEIGIRMALGAQRRDLLHLVLGQGLLLVTGGLVIGLGVALAASKLLATLLYGIPPRDLATFAGVTTAVIVVAIAASSLPALRAARVDPSVALRNE